ncbi:hypothetical protein KAU11_09895 [Candidatus Babeliales bacterium]|nr:hypothetical protein [Candidatus Babeliales bacterium]
MAAGDVTIVKYSAGDEAAAQTALESLVPAAGNFIVQWQQNNMIFVAKIEQT